MRSFITKLKRQVRKLRQPPYLKDPKKVGYWIDLILDQKEAFIIQIGSNDGKTGDPIFPLLNKNKNWKGLFVEPIPIFFEKLKQNYPDCSKYSFEKAAITNKKEVFFYSVSQEAKNKHPDLPFWFNQLGSFDKQHILNHFDGKLEPYIEELEVETLSLPDLMTKHSVSNLDLIHIDVEGHDWVVLSQLDLDKYNPVIILFEYHHLSNKDIVLACKFISNNYYIFDLGIDLFAVNKKIDANTIQKMKSVLTSYI